ncbi:MAG: biotin-dependent carboxyltransferase family protein [Ornithinibacter sp.]
MSAALEVLATGPLVLVEDDGRPGLAAVGVGRSGAADRASYRLGARLVGHDPGHAALEVLLGGLTLRAHGRVTVALTGAPAPATVDGRPVAHAGLVDVPDRAVLALGMPATGLRTYLTVRGGIDVPPVLGSRSTDTLAQLGPPPVRVGDVLPVGPPGRDFPTVDHAARPSPDGGEPAVLEVLPGPRAAWVGGWSTGLGGLIGVRRDVSADSDRAGVRLAGSPVQRAAPWRDVELPSEGMVRGAVQVPPGGEPVLFLADHPVTGGYPVVGVLTASACDRAAQLRPGESVRLVQAAPRA